MEVSSRFGLFTPGTHEIWVREFAALMWTLSVEGIANRIVQPKSDEAFGLITQYCWAVRVSYEMTEKAEKF
jgi:hypothetical protein